MSLELALVFSARAEKCQKNEETARRRGELNSVIRYCAAANAWREAAGLARRAAKQRTEPDTGSSAK